MSRAVLFEAKL